MSIGLILIILLVIFLLGGFSGRFGGYGYGYGHGGIGVIGIILIVLVVVLLIVILRSNKRNVERGTVEGPELKFYDAGLDNLFRLSSLEQNIDEVVIFSPQQTG